jgi:hypothetical protein
VSRYASAAAFKQAVENRLRSASSSGVNFARRRQRLVFDRLLARLTREFGDSAMLKGGLVVELRVERARTTKDIDLRLVGRQRNFSSVSSARPKRTLRKNFTRTRFRASGRTRA